MKHYGRGLVALAILPMLAACGSSPPVRYFNLEPAAIDYRQDPIDAVVLGLGPLRVPDYLKRPQLVTRGGGAELIVDDFSRWAEPLDYSVGRVLATSVDSLLEDVIVVAFPYGSLVRIDYRLIGSITRFDADQSGEAVLIAEWGITDTEGTILVVSHRTRYEAQASSSDDSGAIVLAMNDALGQFSRDIAATLEEAVRQRSGRPESAGE